MGWYGGGGGGDAVMEMEMDMGDDGALVACATLYNCYLSAH